MPKNSQKTAKFVSVRASAMALIVCSVMLTAGLASPFVGADSYDAKINALKDANSDVLKSLGVLTAKAHSYQDAIDKLRQQINSLQKEIDANQAKQAALKKEIAAKQVEIDYQRKVLGSALRAMYVDDQMSTIEMLATSNNLSDYVDKEEYRATVQNKIQETLAKIVALQKELQSKKAVVDRLLADERSEQEDLATAKAEQDELLAYNESQQNSFNSQLKNNNAKIAKLRAQQAAENARLYAGGGSYIVAGNNGNDTYPNKWRNAVQDSMIDSWGMYNRECVSYTAWKVYESGRYMPYWGGHGNAKLWDDNARAAGIPVSTTPRVGDVAVKNAGYYGHVMYVEHVYSDGAIYISQYNQDLTGHYSEAYISASTVAANNLQFIHFQ
ncbi:CHAP domain-containing protein [Candidatus Saccharibacteria bacterium]|nr:CHAP domain-containing protein [Candidatus Saccharibacteria bacterium]